MSQTNWIVVNGGGLYVRAQMDTTNSKNIVRRMSFGEGFVVHETYNVKGMSGLQTWGRVSNNPGGISQEYVCLSIGNKVYARQEGAQIPPVIPAGETTRLDRLEAWARTQGYQG